MKVEAMGKGRRKGIIGAITSSFRWRHGIADQQNDERWMMVRLSMDDRPIIIGFLIDKDYNTIQTIGHLFSPTLSALTYLHVAQKVLCM